MAGKNDQKGAMKKKVAPRGEFVWAMDGKTLHPARLMIPREENRTKMTRLSEVEVQWTQTGYRQLVLHDQVEYGNDNDTSSGSKRSQRPTRRAALSSSPAEEKGKRTPSSTRKQNNNTPSSQKKRKAPTGTRARPTPPKKEKEKSLLSKTQTQEVVAAEDNTSEDDGKKVEVNNNNSSVELLPQVTKLSGGQKRERSLEVLQARDIISYDEEPPAKKRKNLQVTRRSITPPPLSPVDQDDCKVPAVTVVTASEVNVNLLQVPWIDADTKEATHEAVVEVENNAESSVLETFTSPLSSAKEMVVSGLLGLYKGFLGSSSPS